MMRNNRILSAAVAAALFLPISSAYAAGGFVNVNNSLKDQAVNDTTVSAASVVSTCSATAHKKAGTCTINSSFNFTGNALTVVNVPDDGLIYATELFTGPGGTPVLPGCEFNDADAPRVGAEAKAAVLYTTGSETLKTLDEMGVKFTLTGATFAEDPVLGISDNGGLFSIEAKLKGGKDKTFIEYKFNTTTNKIYKGNQLMLQYRLKDATGLATPEAKVTMKAEVEKDATREVTIATSLTALEYTLYGQEEGKVQIDVTNDNKRFAENGELPAYQEDVPNSGAGAGAAICYIKINSFSDDTPDNNDIVQCDGSSEFKFGLTTAGDLALAPESKLEITGGQFAASNKDRVYIETGGTNASTGKVTKAGNTSNADMSATTVVDDSTATWKLQDNMMNGFALDTKDMPIIMEIDNSTEINIVEEAPLASLLLDFKQGNENDHKWGIADISLDSECLLIKRNGMVCRVFNVPPAGAQDVLNIRVTNDSSEAGELTMTLYGMDGSELGTGVLATAEEFGPGQTKRFTSTDLGTNLGDITWDKRGMLEIRSILPKVEMMTLLRHQNPNVPLLTNLSSGARGYACEN
jgi:hypothetical protein